MQKTSHNAVHDDTDPQSAPYEKKHSSFFDMKTFSEDNLQTNNLTQELDILRQRSYSCAFFIYPREFVPIPKPKKTKDIPSPLRLNAKSFKEYKRNKMSNFLIETDDLYISCPEDDDIDSNEETIASTSHHQETLSQIKSERKAMEQIKCQSTKNASKEYESILKNNQFKKETTEVLQYKRSIKKPQDSKIKKGLSFLCSHAQHSEDYLELGGAIENESAYFQEIKSPKARSLSILSMLEISSDIKKKLSQNVD